MSSDGLALHIYDATTSILMEWNGKVRIERMSLCSTRSDYRFEDDDLTEQDRVREVAKLKLMKEHDMFSRHLFVCSLCYRKHLKAGGEDFL